MPVFTIPACCFTWREAHEDEKSSSKGEGRKRGRAVVGITGVLLVGGPCIGKRWREGREGKREGGREWI